MIGQLIPPRLAIATLQALARNGSPASVSRLLGNAVRSLRQARLQVPDFLQSAAASAAKLAEQKRALDKLCKDDQLERLNLPIAYERRQLIGSKAFTAELNNRANRKFWVTVMDIVGSGTFTMEHSMALFAAATDELLPQLQGLGLMVANSDDEGARQSFVNLMRRYDTGYELPQSGTDEHVTDQIRLPGLVRYLWNAAELEPPCVYQKTLQRVIEELRQGLDRDCAPFEKTRHSIGWGVPGRRISVHYRMTDAVLKKIYPGFKTLIVIGETEQKAGILVHYLLENSLETLLGKIQTWGSDGDFAFSLTTKRRSNAATPLLQVRYRDEVIVEVEAHQAHCPKLREPLLSLAAAIMDQILAEDLYLTEVMAEHAITFQQEAALRQNYRSTQADKPQTSILLTPFEPPLSESQLPTAPVSPEAEVARTVVSPFANEHLRSPLTFVTAIQTFLLDCEPAEEELSSFFKNMNRFIQAMKRNTDLTQNAHTLRDLLQALKNGVREMEPVFQLSDIIRLVPTKLFAKLAAPLREVPKITAVHDEQVNELPDELSEEIAALQQELARRKQATSHRGMKTRKFEERMKFVRRALYKLKKKKDARWASALDEAKTLYSQLSEAAGTWHRTRQLQSRPALLAAVFFTSLENVMNFDMRPNQLIRELELIRLYLEDPKRPFRVEVLQKCRKVHVGIPQLKAQLREKEQEKRNRERLDAMASLASAIEKHIEQFGHLHDKNDFDALKRNLKKLQDAVQKRTQLTSNQLSAIRRMFRLKVQKINASL